jgi:Probable Zinc-ribbon domain
MARVSSDYNLAVIHSTLVGQCRPHKNSDLTPREVTRDSNRKVWWICRKGHEWQATIVDMTAKGQGCAIRYREMKKSHSLQIDNPKLTRAWQQKRDNGLQARLSKDSLVALPTGT